MAWFAELKRRNWYCICGDNMITMYREFLFQEWYSSLTEEEKAEYERLQEEKKRQDEIELNTSLAKLAAMNGILAGACARSGSNSSDFIDKILNVIRE